MPVILRRIFLAFALLLPVAAIAQPAPQGGPLSSLPNASLPLNGGELTYLVQGGVSKKTTVSGLLQSFPGIIEPGLVNELAWYGATGTTLSGLPTIANGVLVTSASGVPSISTTLPPQVVVPAVPKTPQQFGAKCDGSTDDTAALTAWAASLTAGSAGYVPSGNCIFKSPITFPKVNYVSLIGNGQDSRLTYAGATTTGNLLTIGVANDSADSYCSVTGWTIKGLKIYSSTSQTAGDLFRLNDVCNSDISNLWVNGFGYNAVHFNGGNTIHLRGYSFSGINTAEIINGDAAQQFTDMFQSGGGQILAPQSDLRLPAMSGA